MQILSAYFPKCLNVSFQDTVCVCVKKNRADILFMLLYLLTVYPLKVHVTLTVNSAMPSDCLVFDLTCLRYKYENTRERRRRNSGGKTAYNTTETETKTSVFIYGYSEESQIMHVVATPDPCLRNI